jgi:thioredoxin reductase (NADPH)
VTCELLVIGAGPAGVSAALWARSQGLDVRVIEGGSAPGGQLHHVHFHPSEVAGFPDGDGPALADAFARQLRDAAIDVRYGAEARALDPGSGGDAPPAVTLEDGERIAGLALLVATGVRRRTLGVPGEAELADRGVSYSARRDRAAFAGQDVLVVGGGDAAYENALLLTEVDCRVTIAARRTPRARREFKDRVRHVPGIDVLEGARVAAILGDDRVRAVRLEHHGEVLERRFAAVVIKVGVVPNTEWCRDRLAHDAEGFLVVDARHRCSADRVWAAGDVVRPRLLAVVVALGAAALAVADVRAVLRGH